MQRVRKPCTSANKETLARLKGERVRVMENIAARTELPKQQWWLSFADEEGFRGVVIVHAGEFAEAVMECNIHACNPHGEVQGMPVPGRITIPPEFTYRILDRREAEKVDQYILRTFGPPGKREEGAL